MGGLMVLYARRRAGRSAAGPRSVEVVARLWGDLTAAPLAAIEPAPQAAASDEDSGDDSDQVVLERQPPRATPAVSPGTPVRLHWRSLSDGALVCFLITAPSLFAGFILRDQRMRVWVLMLPVAAAGFFLGGAIAGRHRRARGGSRGSGRRGLC